jgi:type VI secretion system protein ImpL
VFGEAATPLAIDDQLTRDVIGLYERDYIVTWDGVLADLEVKPLGSAENAAKSLGILGSSSSPLKVLLTVVAKETNLTPAEDPSAAATLADKALAKASSSPLSKLLKGAGTPAAPAVPVAKPGAAVTAHFAEVQQLVAGPPGQAPIDRTLALLAQMSTQLGAMSDSVGGAAALQEVTSGGGGGAARAIEIEAAQLPPAVAGVLGPLAGSSQTLVRTQASGELAGLYRGEVVAECNAIVAGRYPFARGAAADVPVADFARLFGSAGSTIRSSRRTRAVIDTTRSPWRWREAGGGSMGLPASIPAQFEAVDRIRQQYFRQGGTDPEVRFTLMPERLDADVRRFVLETGEQTLEYAHGRHGG